MIVQLVPADKAHRVLRSHAIDTCIDLVHSRWLIIEQAQTSLPWVFLGMLVFWLTVLFVSLGLLAPRNATTRGSLFVCRGVDGRRDLSDTGIEPAARRGGADFAGAVTEGIGDDWEGRRLNMVDVSVGGGAASGGGGGEVTRLDSVRWTATAHRVEDIDHVRGRCSTRTGGDDRARPRGVIVTQGWHGRFRVNMNLTVEWVAELARHGCTAVRWSTIGDPCAEDSVIMAWARANRHVEFAPILNASLMTWPGSIPPAHRRTKSGSHWEHTPPSTGSVCPVITPWAAFHPLGTEGGYNSPEGRLAVESGLFNFELRPPN